MLFVAVDPKDMSIIEAGVRGVKPRFLGPLSHLFLSGSVESLVWRPRHASIAVSAWFLMPHLRCSHVFRFVSGAEKSYFIAEFVGSNSRAQMTGETAGTVFANDQKRSVTPGTDQNSARLRNRRRRRLLETTNTEENAMAAPAIMGLSSPAAASGSAARL
jgi:hypothetical protein